MKTPHLYYGLINNEVLEPQPLEDLAERAWYVGWSAEHVMVCPVGSTEWVPAATVQGFRRREATLPAYDPQKAAAESAAAAEGWAFLVQLFLVLLMCSGVVVLFMGLSMETSRPVPGMHMDVINLPTAQDQQLKVMVGGGMAATGLLGLLIYRPRK